MLGKVLVANRGEIAVRVLRACRELGLPTVAVYSTVDADAPHALLADEAVPLAGATARESYLDRDQLLDAARRTGAAAIHPGYGFLSENAPFAAACRDAGLVFVGPPAEVIAALGDKAAARALAERAGVPVVPGGALVRGSTADAARSAQAIGYPLLLKAVAGGGGKGMRVVHRPEELEAALGSVQHEAKASFGDDGVLLERFLVAPRHIEVQVLADAYGAAVHLGERECSLQRRHQKILEESPSVAVSPELRRALGEAALKVVRAAGYVNAGTVEFLLDKDGSFYFLEVNTRLQVEHPVTELVSGLDLVHEQLRIAAGEPLGLTQEAIGFRGHAIQCRIYAEDPERDFVPSPGVVLHLSEPSLVGLRIDSGIRAGQRIPVHYDPILAKLIVWAPDRARAIARMRQALLGYVVLGPATNVSYLRAIIEHPAFAAGELSTEFLRQHLDGWRRHPPDAAIGALAAALWARGERRSEGAETPESPRPDPWGRLEGFRMG